nr:MAG TPA: hypothetical protein [Caudoviricetes sp.]
MIIYAPKGKRTALWAVTSSQQHYKQEEHIYEEF